MPSDKLSKRNYIKHNNYTCKSRYEGNGLELVKKHYSKIEPLKRAVKNTTDNRAELTSLSTLENLKEGIY